MKLRKDLTNTFVCDFESAARRSLKERLNYSFIHTYKPVLDDPPYFRSFRTISEYRRWAEKKLPAWLGYGKKI
ncbi:MAG: hypothetical protein QME68_06470 [Elusimicrobiota bacterium]|nr:hypothetical protein [Elusimicrobiota bacterium]